METPEDERTVDNRVAYALDRIKQLVEDVSDAEHADHTAPRNVEEAVSRLKSQVPGDGA